MIYTIGISYTECYHMRCWFNTYIYIFKCFFFFFFFVCGSVVVQIGVEGAEHMAEALKYNSTVSTLDLRANKLGDKVGGGEPGMVHRCQ